MKLLREFIRENIGSIFSLGRFVTMNALADVGSRYDVDSRRSEVMHENDVDNVEELNDSNRIDRSTR